MAMPLYNQTKQEQSFVSHGNLYRVPAGSDQEPGMALVPPRVARSAVKRWPRLFTLDRPSADPAAPVLPLEGLEELNRSELLGVVAWLSRKQLAAKQVADLTAAQLAELARKLAAGQAPAAAVEELFAVPAPTDQPELPAGGEGPEDSRPAA